MGEYARRKSDGSEVKIGTCECMYYLRYDQRNEVDYDFGSYEWLWRIPYPEEDGTQAGEYHFGGLLRDGYVPYELSLKPISGELAEQLISFEGLTQIYNEKLGMLINMPCYHGLKLPESINGFGFFWNGKREALHLCYLVNKEKELEIGIKCNACGKMFSGSFKDIAPIMRSLWMKLRLLRQCSEYWSQHNEELCPYSVIDKDADGKPMEICNLDGAKDGWQVDVNDATIKVGTWEDCRNEFIKRLGNGDLDKAFERGRGEYEYYIEVRDMKDRYHIL